MESDRHRTTFSEETLQTCADLPQFDEMAGDSGVGVRQDKEADLPQPGEVAEGGGGVPDQETDSLQDGEVAEGADVVPQDKEADSPQAGESANSGVPQ